MSENLERKEDMDMNQTVATHIELRTNRNGQPRAFIEGTRVRVQDIYGLSQIQGLSPERIVEELPHLTLGQVHAALAYFYDHPDDIYQELRESQEAVAELRARTGPGPLEERRRAKTADGE